MSSFFKDLLFPRHCLSCGALGSFICLRCQKSLQFVQKERCFYCGRQSFQGFTHPVCRKFRGVDGFRTIYRYENVMKRIMKGIKYRLAREALDELLHFSAGQIGLTLKYLKDLNIHIAIQPVPLHKARLHERGFNQADIIVRNLSALLGFPTVSVLQRVRKTEPQAQLSSGQKRYQNLRAAFAVSPAAVVPQNILLVDDVATTGSTLASAVRELKRAGAKQVFVFSLAKG